MRARRRSYVICGQLKDDADMEPSANTAMNHRFSKWVLLKSLFVFYALTFSHKQGTRRKTDEEEVNDNLTVSHGTIGLSKAENTHARASHQLYGADSQLITTTSSSYVTRASPFAQRAPCRDWRAKGQCSRGSHCRFSHAPDVVRNEWTLLVKC